MMSAGKKTAAVLVAVLVTMAALSTAGTANARGFGRQSGYDLGEAGAAFADGASAASADGPFGYGYGYGQPFAYEPYGSASPSGSPPHFVYYGYPHGGLDGYGLYGY